MPEQYYNLLRQQAQGSGFFGRTHLGNLRWQKPMFELGKLGTVSLGLPGIYRWHIEDSYLGGGSTGIYIGMYSQAGRPLDRYADRVEQLLSGRNYSKAKPEGFRAIHHVLANAVLDDKKINLTFLENRVDELSVREGELRITERDNLNDKSLSEEEIESLKTNLMEATIRRGSK